MALGKVEICGFNTAKLPLLKMRTKKNYLKELSRVTKKQGKFISKEICVLCLV